MAYLYHNKTGDVVAVFENGRVYKDIWCKQLLGTYKNEKIFIGKGIFKQLVGTYNGDIHDFITGPFEVVSKNKVGYVLGDNIYAGDVDEKSKKVAHFDGSDKFGAAAAALLSGIFSRSDKIDDAKL